MDNFWEKAVRIRKNDDFNDWVNVFQQIQDLLATELNRALTHTATQCHLISARWENDWLIDWLIAKAPVLNFFSPCSIHSKVSYENKRPQGTLTPLKENTWSCHKSFIQQFFKAISEVVICCRCNPDIH